MKRWLLWTRVAMGVLMACGLGLRSANAGEHDRDRDDLIHAQDFAVNLQAPTIMPAAGNYPGSLRVRVSHPLQDVVLYYTLDGSEPTNQSMQYVQPFWLTAGATVKARAYRKGNHGAIAESLYGVTEAPAVATPTATPNGGTFVGSVKIALATATSGADFYYTLDGSDPTPQAFHYDGAIWLAGHAILKAVAYKEGMSPSQAIRTDFLVNAGDAAATPEISPAGGEYDNSVKVTVTMPATPTPSPQPTPVPPPQPSPEPEPQPFVHAAEAEAGTLTAPMVAVDLAGASGGKVITSPTAEQGTAVYTVTLPKAETYYLWGRIVANSADADEVYLKVDSGEELVYVVSGGTYNEQFRWTQVKIGANARSFELSVGAHTFTVRAKEPNAKIDSVLITNDADFVPTTSNTQALLNASQTSGGYGAATIPDETAPGQAELHYTFNGQDPTPYSALYTGALTLTTSATLKVAAFVPGKGYSAPAKAVYTIKTTPTKLIATVTDRNTDKPIAGASVAVLNLGGKELVKGTTGSDGVASLEIPAAAMGEETDKTVKILIGAPNYVELSKKILIRRGIENAIVVDLEPKPATDKTVVIVTVMDEKTNKPIANAKVVADPKQGPAATGRTDAAGLVRLELKDAPPAMKGKPGANALPQTVELRVTAEGYKEFRKDQEITPGAETAVKVMLTPVVGEPVTKVTVTVKNEKTSAAVAGADVAIEAGGGRVVRGKTDAQGKALLTLTAGGQVQMLPDMAVRLKVIHPDYELYQQDVAVKLGQDNAFDVALKPKVPGVTKVLIKVTSEATKQPLPGADCALKLPLGPEFHATADRTGLATIVIPKTLAAALHTIPDPQPSQPPSPPFAKLTVTAPGHQPYVNEQVTIIEGVENTLEAVLKPLAVSTTRLIVTVTDAATQQPVSGAQAKLKVESPNADLAMFTDQQGKAVFVLPELDAAVTADRPATLVVSVRSYEPNTQQLALKRGQENTIAVMLKAGPLQVTKVIITITDKLSTRPVVAASVELKLAGIRTLRTLSDGAGVATIVVPDLVLAKDGDKASVLTVRARGYDDYTDPNVKLTTGQDNKIAVAMMPSHGGMFTVVVTVTNKVTGGAISGALVELIPAKEGMAVRGFTGPDGVSRLVFPMNDITLMADAPTKVIKMVVTARGFTRYTQENITVSQDKENQLAAAMEPTPSGAVTKVTVTATSATSHQPVAGALVEMQTSDGKLTRTFTDLAGVATMVVLDADSATADRTAKITVTARGYDKAVKENVKLTQGQDVQVAVELTPTVQP